MATLPTKSFTAIVQSIAVGMQGRASAVLDFSIGSTFRALAEGHAGVALWLQGLITKLLLTTRASTASGADLDSWMADFGVARLTATPASGLVNFARFTATSVGYIPVGTQVRTSDLSQTYAVIADSANSAYDAANGRYTLPVGMTSISVPVAALTPSSAGNATAGTITIISTTLLGVDTVSNAGDFINGSDAESDEQLRARFPLFIASLSKATTAAVLYAVASLKLGLQATVVENENYDGSTRYGSFFVVVDDGSGSPPDSVIELAASAVDAVRPLGVTFGVFKPEILYASIALSITTVPGYDKNAVIGIVFQAVQTFVNTLPLGVSLSYLKLAQVAFNASPGVAKIPSLILNGVESGDVIADPRKLVKISTLTVI